MTVAIGAVILVAVLVAGTYLYLQTGTLEEDIRGQANGNGHNGRRGHRVVEDEENDG